MKKEKILFVLPTLKGGGAERVACNLMNSLKKRNYDVGLFLFHSIGDYWNLIDGEIPVYSPNNAGKSFLLKRMVLLIRNARNYDVVFGSMELTPTYLSVIAAKLTGKKVIGWVHINIDSLLDGKNKIVAFFHKNIFIPFFYNRIDSVVFVSKGARDNFMKYLGENNQAKAKCIYNPIKIDEIRCMANEFIEKKYNHLIIAVGRLEKQKNYPLMLKAFKLVLQDIQDAKLMILGQGSEEEYLKKIAFDLGIDKAVFFEGFKKNPYKYINIADVYVLSSRFEGLPTVLIEALALNKQIVSVDCPDGVREILGDGRYGVIVPNYDVNSLSDAIKKALKNKAENNDYYHVTHEAVKQFDSRKIVKEFECLFKIICNE